LHIALLRSANLKDTECYKHAAPPEQSRWVKYIDAVETVSVFDRGLDHQAKARRE
jgi:hypothetical protein